MWLSNAPPVAHETPTIRTETISHDIRRGQFQLGSWENDVCWDGDQGGDKPILINHATFFPSNPLVSSGGWIRGVCWGDDTRSWQARWEDDKEFGHLQGDQFEVVSCWGVSRGGVEFDTDMFSQWQQQQQQKQQQHKQKQKQKKHSIQLALADATGNAVQRREEHALPAIAAPVTAAVVPKYKKSKPQIQETKAEAFKILETKETAKKRRCFAATKHLCLGAKF